MVDRNSTIRVHKTIVVFSHRSVFIEDISREDFFERKRFGIRSVHRTKMVKLNAVLIKTSKITFPILLEQK